MDKLIESVIGIFKNNIKRPTLWLAIIAVISLIALILPYIDHYFFFYDRTTKRVELLQNITTLDMERIESDERLTKEFNLILDDINKHGENNLIGLNAGTLFIQTTRTIQILKFIFGGLLLWILALWILFMNTFNKKSEKLGAFFAMIIFGGITGWISYIIPTFYIPIINYLIVPVLIIVILVIILIKSNKKNKNLL